MRTVTVNMKDELNDVNVERTIDLSNVLVNNKNAKYGFECHVVGSNAEIEASLNNWIEERANEQHDTILTLISWTIN